MIELDHVATLNKTVLRVIIENQNSNHKLTLYIANIPLIKKPESVAWVGGEGKISIKNSLLMLGRLFWGPLKPATLPKEFLT